MGARATDQTGGHLDENEIAGTVAEGVIHGLEAVQIEKEHPDAAVVVGDREQGVVETA